VYTAERMKEDFVRAVTPLGVSAQEARAILLLDEPLPMGALAQRLTCDQSYITRIADDLEAHGLAKRSPGEDRRVQLLTLTRSGARMRDRIIASVSAESLVLQRLDEDQRRTLEELLRLLLDGD
jgi:DNA-binding MarR family transcriptional regulator